MDLQRIQAIAGAGINAKGCFSARISHSPAIIIKVFKTATYIMHIGLPPVFFEVPEELCDRHGDISQAADPDCIPSNTCTSRLPDRERIAYDLNQNSQESSCVI